MLRPADRCDGSNPMTGRVCAKGHHQGYHRDVSGAEWLDDGDMANPDWLSPVQRFCTGSGVSHAGVWG
jgi:hypothetical protein